MGDNRLQILIEGSLNTGKSIGNINTALNGLQKKIKKLNIDISIDQSVLTSIVKFNQNFDKMTQKIKEQNEIMNKFNSQNKNSSDIINRETKAILDAADAQAKWNLQRERTNKQGITTQTWGNSANNNTKQVNLDMNNNRIETPYQVNTKNQLKDLKDIQAQENKLAMQREKESADRQKAWQKEQDIALKVIENERRAEERRISERLKLEQQVEQRWLQHLQERERKETASSQKATNDYTNFWNRALQDRQVKEQQLLNTLSQSTRNGQNNASSSLTNTKAIDIINTKYQQLQARIESLRASGEMLSTSEVAGINRRIQALQALASRQKQSEELSRQQLKAEQDIARLSATYGNKVDANRLQQLNNEIKSLTVNSANFQARAKQVEQEIKLIGDNARIASSETKSFGNSLLNAFKNMAMYAGAGSLFFGTISTLREMISTIVEVDSQITQMKRVMDESTDFNGLMTSSISLANEFGRSIQDVNENLIGFARMGFNEMDTTELAKVATLFQNISDLTPEEAIDSMTAAMINFNINASDSMSIADKINEVKSRPPYVVTYIEKLDYNGEYLTA